jgi:HEAT repeat protein
MERLKDSDGGSRAEAALALGEIHREKAIPLLRPLLTEDPATAKGGERKRSARWVSQRRDGPAPAGAARR